MRVILKIAKAELKFLFYSPVAWIIFVAFFVVSGTQFVNAFESTASVQQFNTTNDPSWQGFDNSLSALLFADPYGFLSTNLFLFIPLLTMGAISRDVSSGAIHLLNSSPIKISQVVLGKYLGLIIYNAVIMLVLLLLMIIACLSIINPEYKLFLSALIGFYLLACTYSAIGLFISSLTNYQVVAALLTLLTLGVLSVISILWQQYDFFRDITYFLNISNRLINMIQGLITTKDIIYFILIISLFLSFTLIRFKNKRESRQWYVFALRYLSALLVVLILGYFSSRPENIGYLDMSRTKINTLHPAIIKSLKELDGTPLKVTLYANILDDSFSPGSPAERNNYVWNIWGKYIRYYPNINFEYVYYYDVMGNDSTFRKKHGTMSMAEVARRTMRILGLPKSLFKKPEEIRDIIDLSGEGKKLVMQLDYKGRKTFLRTYRDVDFWPDQLHFAAAFKKLARNSMPLVEFTSGHYERSPYKTGEREYTAHTLFKGSRIALLNQGVSIDTLSLDTDEIPYNTSILAVADPKKEFSQAEADKITKYLQEGGNAIFYGEPGKQYVLNPILQKIGVRLDSGWVIQLSPEEKPHIVVNEINDKGSKMALERMLFLYQEKKIQQLQLTLFGFANISFNDSAGFKIEPILEMGGNNHSWIENTAYVSDSAAPVFQVLDGDRKKSKYVSGVRISRNINTKQQRIVIISDGDFMSALRFSGEKFGNAAYSWLLDNDYPVYSNYPLPTDIRMKVSRNFAENIWSIFVYVIPSLILITGAIVLIRRQRR